MTATLTAHRIRVSAVAGRVLLRPAGEVGQ